MTQWNQSWWNGSIFITVRGDFGSMFLLWCLRSHPYTTVVFWQRFPVMFRSLLSYPINLTLDSADCVQRFVVFPEKFSTLCLVAACPFAVAGFLWGHNCCVREWGKWYTWSTVTGICSSPTGQCGWRSSLGSITWFMVICLWLLMAVFPLTVSSD